jgi:hypothetical protein
VAQKIHEEGVLLVMDEHTKKDGSTYSGSCVEVTKKGELEIYQGDTFMWFNKRELKALRDFLNKKLG